VVKNPTPSNLATIIRDDLGVIALNECEDRSPLRISDDQKTLFWYSETARVQITGDKCGGWSEMNVPNVIILS
jgi:hypothetical protein